MTRTHVQLRAVAYVRISKDRENETSTTTQRERIEAHCTAHGIELVDVIVEPGRSAYKESRSSRPGFKRAAAMIEGGAANALIVWKVDRCSRNTRDLLELVEWLLDRDATFVSVTEQFDTSTPSGKLMVTIIAALAEMESATKSERVLVWHEHRDAAGAVPVGRTAKGYRRPSTGVLEVDPVEGPLMAAAARRVLAGASMRATQAWLAGEGVTISHTGLAKSFRSATITGHVEVDGELVAGNWPGLIEVDEWRRLVALLADPNRKANHTAGVRQYILTGIARCFCGSSTPMRVKHHPRGVRLLCGACSSSIRMAEVDQLVVADVLARLDDFTWERLRKQGRGLTLKAAEVEAKIAGLSQMMATGELDLDSFRTIRAGLLGQLAASTAEPFELPDVASARDAWPSLGVEARRLVLLAVIKRLEILPATLGVRAVSTERVVLDLR
jgi:DNA invertase Pin-like site-specific DNA recombinase